VSGMEASQGSGVARRHGLLAAVQALTLVAAARRMHGQGGVLGASAAAPALGTSNVPWRYAGVGQEGGWARSGLSGQVWALGAGLSMDDGCHLE
jgi:hypothetical protein